MTLSMVITIQIPYSESLKDKRAILQSVMKKTRDKFNVSIAEIEQNDNVKAIVFEVATVSNNHTHAETRLDEVVRFIERNWESDISFIDTYSN